MDRAKTGKSFRQETMLSTDSGLGSTSHIGARLRALYKSVESEPVPEKFLDLLQQLDDAERHPSLKDGDE